jgi:hypothetical protein
MSMVYGLHDNFDTNNTTIPSLTRKMKTVIRKGEIIRYLAWLDHRDQEWEKQHGKWYMKPINSKTSALQHEKQQQQQSRQYYMNVRAVPSTADNINTGFDTCRFDYSTYEEKQRLFYCWVFFVVSIAILLIILVYRISIYHGYGLPNQKSATTTTMPYYKPTEMSN